MPAKSKSQQRLMGMVHDCQKSGNCASDKIKKIADSIKASDATDFAETKHKNLPNKVKAESYTSRAYDEIGDNAITFKQFIMEGYYTKPPLDRERYAEREGLEGPFSGDNGKVYYYDPKEGKYYDPDTDFYLSQDEYEATQHTPEKRTQLMQQQRERDFARRK